jgi:hypothetical protein
LVADGLSHIKRITEKSGPVYVGEGARGHIRRAAGVALESLTPQVPIDFHRWSSRNSECLRSVRTTITLVFCANFDADDEPPYTVRGAVDSGGRPVLRLTSSLRLASASRNRDLKRWWDEQLAKNRLEVPGVGTYHLEQYQEFFFRGPLVGTEAEVATQLARAAATTVLWIRNLLAENGFRLALESGAERSAADE